MTVWIVCDNAHAGENGKRRFCVYSPEGYARIRRNRETCVKHGAYLNHQIEANTRKAARLWWARNGWGG